MSQTVEQAATALAAAKAAYMDELERDAERVGGSNLQEERGERHQRSLRDDIAQCQQDLEAAKPRAAAE